MSRRRRPPADVTNAWKEQFETAFFELMDSLVKAKGTEEEFARFAPAARLLTRRQFHQVAKMASDYYVEHAGKSPEDLTKNQSDKLFHKALNHALKNLDAG